MGFLINEVNWFLEVRFVSDNRHARDTFHRRLALAFHSNSPLGYCPVLAFQDILFSYFGCITTDSHYEFFLHHVLVLLMEKENISTFWFG